MSQLSQIENRRRERKRSENKFVTSCVFGYWLFLARPMFLLPAIEGRWPFVDFPPVAPGQLVKKTQEIFLSLDGDDDDTFMMMIIFQLVREEGVVYFLWREGNLFTDLMSPCLFLLL